MRPFSILKPFCYALLGSEAVAANDSQCKAILGNPSWPSDGCWITLNNSISGQLIKTVPPGAVCHPDQPTYNETLCPAVQAGWLTAEYHASEPFTSGWNNFDNDTCVPDANLTCSAEGYPVYVVNATCASDVKAGIDFAREHNVRLIVKATGHDYQGRNTGPNSLSIWTHNMKGITINKSPFQPCVCNFSIDGPSVTLQAGSQFGDINAAVSAENLTIVGGGESSVGIMGYLAGGGHGGLSATYGLAADQALEMEVVTPSGHIVVANECQHPDLFWALRGGGGSTFGVVTSVTVKAFPSTPIAVMSLTLGTSVDNPNYWPALAYLLSTYPHLSSLGIGGYSSYIPNITLPETNNTPMAAYGTSFILPFLSSDNTSDSMTAAFTPIVNKVNELFPGQFFTNLNTTVYPSFYSWWLTSNGPKDAGTDQLVGSWLLDEEALTANTTKLAEALKTFTSGGGGANPYLVSGIGVHNAKPRGGSNAVNPAWRKALVHATIGVGWKPLNATGKAIQEDLLTNTYVKALSDLAPNMGAYMSEADVNQPNFQQAFWGDNYERLLKIKRRIDPDDVFWCHPCVGSERWEMVGEALCKI